MHKSEAYAIFDTRYRPNAIVTKNIVDYLRQVYFAEIWTNACIRGVMVRVLASSAIDRG